jgi:hypothetical protein
MLEKVRNNVSYFQTPENHESSLGHVANSPIISQHLLCHVQQCRDTFN